MWINGPRGLNPHNTLLNFKLSELQTGLITDLFAQERACFKSAIKSSASSMPTLKRNKLSTTPAF